MLSIIIPAHNEEQYIELCLNSIKQQSFKDYEIIVICDACTDKTYTLAKKYTKKVYKINKRNVSAARNAGAKKAKYKTLVFIDADSTIAPNLLKEISKIKNYIGGTTKTLSLENKTKAHIMWALGNFCRHFFMAASGLIFCKADLFPGFDEDRKLAEDTHLLKKLTKLGKLKYITNSYIKTSSRRLEKNGYIKTIYKQYTGYFIKNVEGY
ncbi:hypothetical protein COV16_02975 [Candidatus Woesearchaeota archaeon CG10_big_fil_rev_8_21_14_0_10_34_8]|nr:MAG: hypothetical protein COV16_02975 [Candidatus Woesearchaeota archaeon CG10_big_fil_rev_8_21_14_0_10_34_8]